MVANILRGCEGKRRYPDEYVARGVGQILQVENTVKIYMYPCNICRGFHLTKTKQRNEKHDVDWQYPKTRRGA